MKESRSHEHSHTGLSFGEACTEHRFVQMPLKTKKGLLHICQAKFAYPDNTSFVKYYLSQCSMMIIYIT